MAINHTKCANYSCVTEVSWLLQSGEQDYCGIPNELPESWCEGRGGIDHSRHLYSVLLTQYYRFGSLHQYVGNYYKFEQIQATISLNFQNFPMTAGRGSECVLIQSV